MSSNIRSQGCGFFYYFYENKIKWSYIIIIIIIIFFQVSWLSLNNDKSFFIFQYLKILIYNNFLFFNICFLFIVTCKSKTLLYMQNYLLFIEGVSNNKLLWLICKILLISCLFFTLASPIINATSKKFDNKYD